MFSGLLKICLTFIFVFSISSKTYASPGINNYTMETNSLLSVAQPFELAKDITLQQRQNAPLWFTSIIIPGLGQMMMGDYFRGIKFTAGVLITGYTAMIMVPFIGAAGLGSAVLSQDGRISPFVLLLIAALFIDLAAVVGLYTWNIIDAYNMSHEVNASLRTDSLKALAPYLSRQTEKISLSKSGFKFNLATF